MLNPIDPSVSHSEMVRVLNKPGATILATLTPDKVNLIHAALGIASEAGELAGAVKAHIAYNKPLDVANVLEESGDLEFYLEALRQEIRFTREAILAGNMAKLSVRYKDFIYSDVAAKARADKNSE